MEDRVMSRLFVILLLVISVQSNAQNLSQAPAIFDMRKSLPLDDEHSATRDFYINAGAEAGFKKGMFVMVVRQLPIHDPVQNKQQAVLTVPVGQLKILQVEKNITVARLVFELEDDERPTLEFEGVMIGDRVDLSSLSSEGGGDRAKKKPKTKADKNASPEAAPAGNIPGPYAANRLSSNSTIWYTKRP